jgi:DNA-directed RNA polymerase I, II, and III subunit RPABC1
MNNQSRLEAQALKIIKQMLYDRKYVIIDETEKYNIKAEKNNKIILCFICQEEKLNIQGIKDKMSLMNKENAAHAIIVYQNGVTPSVKKSLETCDYTFELFSLKELQINITQHRLVPKHEILEEDLEEIEKYKDKIPILLSSDPISRYYNYQRGNIIKITRKDRSIVYRLVK